MRMAKKVKVLLIGKSGLLGKDLYQSLIKSDDFEVFATGKDDLDITKADKVLNLVTNFSPTFVINCAAYTNVDKAEIEKEICFSTNVNGAINIAHAALRVKASLIQISTASIYSSDELNLISHSDSTNPANYYSLTKLLAEKELGNIFANTDMLFLLRPYWLYGSSQKSFTQFVLRNLREGNPIKVVDDQFGQPTSTGTVYAALLQILNNKVPHGTYAATNSGITNRVGWSNFIAHKYNLNSNLIIPTSAAEFSAVAKRPYNASLSQDCWAPYFEPRAWDKELSDFLNTLDNCQ